MTTQCLRVAVFIPTVAPAVGDAVQVTQVIPLQTRFIEIAGGSFPVPTQEGDVLRADAALNWVVAPVTSIIPDPIRAGDFLVANSGLNWASTVVPGQMPPALAHGDVMQVDASLNWVGARIDGGAL